MPALTKVIDAYAASSPTLDRASFSRLEFWAEILGDWELAAITPEDVDDALVKLAERGRLRPSRGKTTAGAGQPYKGSTLNRYLSTLGTVYKYARRLHTGLRVGNLTALHWRDVFVAPHQTAYDPKPAISVSEFFTPESPKYLGNVDSFINTLNVVLQCDSGMPFASSPYARSHHSKESVMKRIFICTSTAALWLISVPASAGSVPTFPVSEPGILALVAGGIAAAIIVGRIRKK